MKYIILIVAVILLGWELYAYRDRSEQAPAPVDTQAEVETQLAVREFTVTGKPFLFDPSQIEVNEGEMVRITFKNEEGQHDWVIDEFNARTKVLKAGESETIEFLADKKGSFEYYCSVGTHRQMGMKGTLIVK